MKTQKTPLLALIAITLALALTLTLAACKDPDPEPPPSYQTVRVNGGSFQMGKSGDGKQDAPLGDVTPVHKVTLAGFSMGKYPVTQKQWQEVMGTTIQALQTAADPTDAADYGRGGNYPAYYVSWYDAIVFCNRLSMKESLTPAYSIEVNGKDETDPAKWGAASSDAAWNAAKIVAGSKGYRLPTEAQWEYAAKGGHKAGDPYKIYSGSDTVDDVAWYSENAEGKTHEVGTKAANELGLYDMSGNVWEWCWDWYGAYEDSEQTDPEGASSGFGRALRGGDWDCSAARVRSAVRSYVDPYNRRGSLGFRVLRPAQ